MHEYGTPVIKPDTKIFNTSLKNSDINMLKAFAKAMCRQEHSYIAKVSEITDGLNMELSYVK